VAGKKPNGSDDAVVDLGDTLSLSGGHDVRDWVLRVDDGGVRVRQTGGCGAGKAEVAWVSP